MLQILVQIYDVEDVDKDKQFRVYSVKLVNGSRSLRDVTQYYEVSACQDEQGRKGFVVMKQPSVESVDTHG